MTLPTSCVILNNNVITHCDFEDTFHSTAFIVLSIFKFEHFVTLRCKTMYNGKKNTIYCVTSNLSKIL